MIEPVSILWTKTKKNVENIISKYVYYSLSVDSNSTSNISDSFTLERIQYDQKFSSYLKLSADEIKKRIDFINYVRISFNKLTTEERKIIYWTYLDKENNYDDRFIANNLGFSLGYYYIKKKETLIRLAYSLGVEETNDK